MALTERLTAVADAIRRMSEKQDKLTLEQMPPEILQLQPLNFKVAGNPQPEAPAEDTIWVDTDAEITGWVFRADAPETAAEGMVWFCTGMESTVAFNALRKNGIILCPLSAKQYLDGAWTEVKARSYLDGAWRDWSKTPAEYQDVEYIQSTGTQYLAPAFRPDAVSTYRHVFRFNAQETVTENYLLGINSSTERYNFGLKDGRLRIHIGSGVDLLTAPVTADTDYTATLTVAPASVTLKLNETSFGPVTCAVKALSRNPVMLSRVNSVNGTLGNFAKAKLYDWRIYKDEVLLHEYLPCYRVSDSAAGMYDTVEDVFYPNAGTGTFIVGGDV